MISLEKSIDYITIPAILLNEKKEIYSSNKQFNELFDINNKDIYGLNINSDLFKGLLDNPNLLDIINQDLENKHERYLTFKNNINKRYIKVSSLIFKNGSTNYLLLFENITNTYNLSYLYEEIFKNTNMGIIICNEIDNKLIIKSVNPICYDLFHISDTNVINTDIKRYISKNSTKLYDAIKKVSKDGIKKELKKLSYQDKYLNIDIIKAETSDIIILFEDVTLETKIIEKIEKSDKYKTEFLSNMSHEIRSPINSIVGFAELLKDVKNDKEKINQYINIIQKSSESLTKIVNDILDITKIEEGKLEINKTNFNLNQFLEEMLLTNKNKIKNDNVELKLNTQKSDVIITCDSFRLRQIINNLISNATKFTDKGYIEFGYTKTDNFIEFFVKDTGLGIKEEEQIKIFDRYSQALYNNKKTLGHGLGLSISKELVNLMGGKIRLESEYGKGSSFYFTIPNNKTIKRLKNIQNTSEYFNTDFTGKKIMIVEDIEFNIKLLQSYLENTNVEIIIATDGNDAILKYNENKNNLDIILMDIQLPEINGTDVTKIIRTVDKDTIIIAQTAYAMKDDIDGIMECGFNDLIHKPIKKEDLLRMIYKYIS